MDVWLSISRFAGLVAFWNHEHKVGGLIRGLSPHSSFQAQGLEWWRGSRAPFVAVIIPKHSVAKCSVLPITEFEHILAQQ